MPGLHAATIAVAGLVSPVAMAQGLVQAKAKVDDADLRFELPEARERPARVAAVLEVLHGGYTLAARTARPGPEAAPHEGLSALTDESRYLARRVAAVPGDNAQPLDLLALMLLYPRRGGLRGSTTQAALCR